MRLIPGPKDVMIKEIEINNWNTRHGGQMPAVESEQSAVGKEEKRFGSDQGSLPGRSCILAEP